MAKNRTNKANTAETVETLTGEVTEIPAAPESGSSLLALLGASNDGTKRTRTSPRVKAYNAALDVIVSYQTHHADNEDVSEVLRHLRGEVEALRDASPDGDDEGTGSHIRGRAPTMHVVCQKDDGSLHYEAVTGKAPTAANLPGYVACYGTFRNEKTARSVAEKGIAGRESMQLW